MKKMLPICFVMIFFSMSSFGQHKLFFKSFPDNSGLFDLSQINPAIRISPDIRYGIPNLGSMGSEETGFVPYSKDVQSWSFNNEKVLQDAKVYAALPFDRTSTMPIIDLSKGFSSNLPIKEFPKDFPSNMPIVDGKLSVPDQFLSPWNDR